MSKSATKLETKFRSKTTYFYSFDCPCGWSCSNPSYKTKELMVRLHIKNCKEITPSVFDIYTDTETYTDKKGGNKKRAIQYDPIDRTEYRVVATKGKTEFLKL